MDMYTVKNYQIFFLFYWSSIFIEEEDQKHIIRAEVRQKRVKSGQECLCSPSVGFLFIGGCGGSAEDFLEGWGHHLEVTGVH